jgi:hypothetical protein
MAYERGIEIEQKSMKAIDEVVPPINKTQLQPLISKINFIRRFISNLSERMLLFSPLLKLKADQEFRWGDVEQQKVFDEIREYMKSPPVHVECLHVVSLPSLESAVLADSLSVENVYWLFLCFYLFLPWLIANIFLN